VEINERFKDVFENIGTGNENLSLDRIPAAADVMLSPLGSPTIIPTSGRMLSRKIESEFLKIVLVAPQSWIGIFEVSYLKEVELLRLPVVAVAMWSPLSGPAAIPSSMIRF
jgi:hypothetical protein